MTVSEAKKYALVINGDTETRHLKNVASAVKVLQKEGYEVLVSPSKTYSDIQKTIQKLKDLLKGKSPSELVIYATGHGSLNKEDAQICFADGCNGDAMGILLDELPYQKRTFIMDQCYSGNWSRRFTNKSKTLFISLGSPNEKDTCHEFAPYFWSEDVLDANKDGILSWQERYAYALPHVQRSFPQFIMSPGYKQNGRAPFDSRVTHVADKQYLDRELEKLKQGQSAVVLFAASWCGACKEYKPHFENFAVEDNGQHLFLYTENESLADLYQVKAVPSLFVIQPSPTGVAEKKYHIRLIEDRENLPVEIAESVLSVKDRISLIREQIQNVDKRGQLNLLGQLRRIVPLASPEDLEQIDSFFRGFLESEDEKVRQSAVHLYAEVVTKIYEKNDAKLMTDLAKPELQSNISYFSFLLNKFFNEFFYNQPDAVFNVLFPLLDHNNHKIVGHMLKMLELYADLGDIFGLPADKSWFRRVYPKVTTFLSDPDLQWVALHIVFDGREKLSQKDKVEIQDQFLKPYEGKPEKDIVQLMFSIEDDVSIPCRSPYGCIGKDKRSRKEELLKVLGNEKLQDIAVELYLALIDPLEKTKTTALLMEKLRLLFDHPNKNVARKAAYNYAELWKRELRYGSHDFDAVLKKEAQALYELLHKSNDQSDLSELVEKILQQFPNSVLSRARKASDIPVTRSPNTSTQLQGELSFHLGLDGIYMGFNYGFSYPFGNHGIGFRGGIGNALEGQANSEGYLMGVYSHRFFERTALMVYAGPAYLLGISDKKESSGAGLHYGTDILYTFENGLAVGVDILFQSRPELIRPVILPGVFIGSSPFN